MIEVERISSGINGLDPLIEGGFPRKRTVLIVGAAGTGKSIMATQFLVKSATQKDEPGVLVALEEEPEKIIANMMRFGWDLEALVESDLLRIVRAIPTRLSKERYILDRVSTSGYRDFSVENLASLVHDNIQQINATHIVFDPISSLEFYESDIFRVRQEISVLAKSMESRNMTTLMIAESSTGSPTGRFGIETFIADGVIVLYYLRKGNRRVRALEILKMRGTNHSPELIPFTIDSKGLRLLKEK